MTMSNSRVAERAARGITGSSANMLSRHQYRRVRLDFRAGELPLWACELITRQEVSMLVYSYATPIAWTGSYQVWCVPDVNYSPTTSRHQSIMIEAIKERDALIYRPTEEEVRRVAA